jgi:hypothetical protein
MSHKKEICRKILEDIYGRKYSFDKARPEWLKNPNTGCKLELDCYNEELKIALVYHSIHHYEYPNMWNKIKEDFIEQIKRDKSKKKQCHERGINLIVVPHVIPDSLLSVHLKT